MERFQLKLKNKIKEAKGLKRKYQSAIVSCSLADSLDVISSHKLQSLKIKFSEQTMLSTLMEVLNRFPSLKVLDIDLKIVDDITGNGNFKKIQITPEELRCTVEIIHLFDCSTVKILAITWYNSVDENRKMMAIDFLKQQRNLEDFTLHGDNSSEFFTLSEIFDLKFALKKLRLNCESLGTSFLHHDTLIRLLDRHKQTLICLEIHFCTEPKFGIKLIHKFVLENLTNLKEIEFGHICNDDDDNDNAESRFPFDELPLATQITKNINSIDVVLTDDENEYKRFFAMFPNLKHLRFWHIDESDTSFPSYISEINTKLETLQFWNYGRMYDPANAFVYFPNLKEICVYEYEYDDMCDFINRHSNTLEKISLHNCRYLTYQTTRAILNCVNLKNLDICFHNTCVCALSMFNEIALRTRPFTLKVYFSSFNKSYIFPEDKAIWDEDMETLC